MIRTVTIPCIKNRFRGRYSPIKKKTIRSRTVQLKINDRSGTRARPVDDLPVVGAALRRRARVTVNQIKSREDKFRLISRLVR